MNIKFWKNKKVLITGFNGFKGSWLCLILSELQAKIYGYSLKNKENQRNEEIFELKKILNDYIHGDISDINKLNYFYKKVKPDIVIHLAAQSLVFDSYKKPKKTFETNFNGILNLLTVSKKKTTQLIITSDKCYKNTGKSYFKEDDHLGGDDPYSASKAAAEILVNSYRASFKFNISTVRAGNVIGGGDWSKNRLVPDIINSIYKKKVFKLRNPNQYRPWQHVIDINFNYLQLLEMLFQKKILHGSWNMGPKKSHSVKKVINLFLKEKKFSLKKIKSNIKEKNYIFLNTSKSRKLGIDNKYSLEESVKNTFLWYEEYFKNKKNILQFSKKIITSFLNEYRSKKI